MVNISDLQALRNSLQQGDSGRIANLTGYTNTYVSLVLNGKRPPNRRIIETAEEIIAERKQTNNRIKEKIKNL